MEAKPLAVTVVINFVLNVSGRDWLVADEA